MNMKELSKLPNDKSLEALPNVGAVLLRELKSIGIEDYETLKKNRLKKSLA